MTKDPEIYSNERSAGKPDAHAAFTVSKSMKGAQCVVIPGGCG